MNYGIRVVETLFLLNFIDQMGTNKIYISEICLISMFVESSESCLAQEMSIFGRRELWHRLTQPIMGKKSLWVHQNNATGLLFGRT